MTTVFGTGADTNTYDDFEHTDVIIAWGSNTQEAHPIIYNHIRRGIKNGAKFIVVDPRRLPMASAAAEWLAVRVGSDIALANAIGHVIIEENLYNPAFVERATEFFEQYMASVAPYTPEFVEQVSGVPADQIRRVARLYAKADRAMLAWTLGVTEHHNGTNNVHALVNLALLTGHVGKPGSGLMPLRGQNNVQGGGDMGALPNKLPGFFNVEDDEARARFEQAWNCVIPSTNGLNLSAMQEAMRKESIRFLYIIGENPVQSDANSQAVREGLGKLDTLVVQDLFLTETAQLADVVLPASGWAEVDGTFTNSERGVQRVRRILAPPGEAKDDLWILTALANRLGQTWNYSSAQDVWEEIRSLSPAHFGISYDRLEKEREVHWPCYSPDEPAVRILHTRLHSSQVGTLAKFVPVEYERPADEIDAEYPMILITGRRLAFYNTGVTTHDYGPKVKNQEEYLEMNPEDAAELGYENGTVVRVTSRRGHVIVPVRLSNKMASGTLFMSFHFPEQVDTNRLITDQPDPKSGVTPYKYTAVRLGLA